MLVDQNRIPIRVKNGDCKIVCVNGQSRKMCEEAKEENPYDHSTRTDR